MSDELLERVRGGRATTCSGATWASWWTRPARVGPPPGAGARRPAQRGGRSGHGGVYSALVDTAVGGALSTLHEAAEGGVGQRRSI